MTVSRWYVFQTACAVSSEKRPGRRYKSSKQRSKGWRVLTRLSGLRVCCCDMRGQQVPDLCLEAGWIFVVIMFGFLLVGGGVRGFHIPSFSHLLG